VFVVCGYLSFNRVYEYQLYRIQVPGVRSQQNRRRYIDSTCVPTVLDFIAELHKIGAFFIFNISDNIW
jgi:hypothetical protein